MLDLDVQKLIFEFLGGLGIFLFGIKFMGEGLQKSAGNKLRDILDRFTTNPIMGIFAGIIVTVLIQSSSGTTVLTVGLVNAGFMTLKQAIGVIMGANIGTTVTAFIIGLNITDYALPIIALGSALIFFFKSKKINYFGQFLFGFGALFFGLELMSNGMKPLRTLEAFHELTVSMSSNPILGVVIGTIFTVIVQSSSATIGILQELYAQGAVTLNAALPVLFGDNIGTTITAILASLGASIAARRAALTHVIFNLIGTIIFLIALGLFTSYVGYLQATLHLNPEMTIAFAHGTFNVVNTIIQAPFIAVLAWIVTKLIPGQDNFIDFNTKGLDPLLIEQSPSVALGQAKKELLRMGEFAIKGLEESKKYAENNLQMHAELGMQYEQAINNLDRKITQYLVDLTSSELTEKDSETHSILMDTVNDIERMGDHLENIIELVDYKIANKILLTDMAMEDLEEMFTLTITTVKEALQSLDTLDINLAKKVVQKEEQIDKMERSLRKKHILRLNEGLCQGAAGIVFVDIVSNLERIGDHASNIAEAIIGEDTDRHIS